MPLVYSVYLFICRSHTTFVVFIWRGFDALPVWWGGVSAPANFQTRASLLLDHFQGVESKPIARSRTLDEMVCRALYSFPDKKLIEVTRTEFVLTDHEGLAQLSEYV